jgi:hypothetical protein
LVESLELTIGIRAGWVRELRVSTSKKGGSGGSSGKGSIQRVVREVDVGPANWPLLFKVNYTKWALIMKINIQARNLWEAIEPGSVSLH